MSFPDLKSAENIPLRARETRSQRLPGCGFEALTETPKNVQAVLPQAEVMFMYMLHTQYI